MRGSSGASVGETGLLLNCEGKVGIPLESKQENLPSSPDEVRNAGLFSGFGWNLGAPLKFRQESREPL